jgi:hypothetical protein
MRALLVPLDPLEISSSSTRSTFQSTPMPGAEVTAPLVMMERQVLYVPHEQG